MYIHTHTQTHTHTHAYIHTTYMYMYTYVHDCLPSMHIRIFLSPFSLSNSFAMSLFSKYLKNRHMSELVTPAYKHKVTEIDHWPEHERERERERERDWWGKWFTSDVVLSHWWRVVLIPVRHIFLHQNDNLTLPLSFLQHQWREKESHKHGLRMHLKYKHSFQPQYSGTWYWKVRTFSTS